MKLSDTAVFVGMPVQCLRKSPFYSAFFGLSPKSFPNGQWVKGAAADRFQRRTVDESILSDGPLCTKKEKDRCIKKDAAVLLERAAVQDCRPRRHFFSARLTAPYNAMEMRQRIRIDRIMASSLKVWLE